MSDLQAHNRSMWMANMRDFIRDLAKEGARERLERLLLPLRGDEAELLVEKADGDCEEFAEALHSTVLDYELAMQDMFTATRDQWATLAMVCEWCGEQSCSNREQHRQLNAQREQTWREPVNALDASYGPDEPCECPPGRAVELNGHAHDAPWGCTGCNCRHWPIPEASAAGAVGAPTPSAPSSSMHREQSAAADGAAGLPGPAAHPTGEGGAGADTGRSVPALGDREWPCGRTGGY